MSMDKTSRIYVAGHRGLVGSAILRRLVSEGYSSILVQTHAELDLTEQSSTREFFERERPEYVFLAAAKVGGILANNTYPAEFIRQNLAIQTNVIHESWRVGVKRLLFLGSSCIYPRDCPQPIKEEYLLTGPLEPTNRPYALAKIAGIEMCWCYNRQYGTQFLAAMPTNLYGPGDNYDLETSHVIPALIRKFHEAKVQKHERVLVWGSGTPRREFLYSDDMADACLLLMSSHESTFRAFLNFKLECGELGPPLINIGAGVDFPINEVAEVIRAVVGYSGSIEYDSTRPDGTPRKLLDTERIRVLKWQCHRSLEEGIALAYEDFLRAA